MLKAILLDFDQTVVNSSEGFRAAEHWLQREIYSFLSLAEWDSFIEVYRGFRERAPADRPEQKCSQWSALCQYHETEPGRDVMLRWQEGYWSRVERGSTLFRETIEVLTKLKSHFRLGIVTNAYSPDGKSHRIDRFPQLKMLIDELVICGRGGVPLKPDPEGFCRILVSLGVDADEALFVGDDLETDVKAARNAGLLPVWLRHREINWSRPEPDDEGTIRIDSLEPLVTISASDTLQTVPQALRRYVETSAGRS